MTGVFMFSKGHISIRLSNGYRVSLCNYEGAHCNNVTMRSNKEGDVSSDAEIMVFDPSGNDITKVLYPDASPDASNKDPDDLANLLNTLQEYRGSFTKEDLK